MGLALSLVLALVQAISNGIDSGRCARADGLVGVLGNGLVGLLGCLSAGALHGLADVVGCVLRGDTLAGASRWRMFSGAKSYLDGVHFEGR